MPAFRNAFRARLNLIVGLFLLGCMAAAFAAANPVFSFSYGAPAQAESLRRAQTQARGVEPTRTDKRNSSRRQAPRSAAKFGGRRHARLHARRLLF